MKLLLIDVDEAFAHQLRGELLRSGAMLCDLELATSLADAAIQLSADRFDAILIDPFSLEGAPTSVYGDLEQLAPRTPILVLTNETDDESAIEAVRQGAHDYLVKDQSQPEWLLRRVRFAIDRRRGASARAKLSGPHSARRTEKHARPFAHASVDGTRQPVSQHANSARTASSPNQSSGTMTLDFDEEIHDYELETREIDKPSDSKRWHVLHIEADPAFRTLSDKLLQCESSHALNVTHADCVSEAAEELQLTSYDAVLLGVNQSDTSAQDSLTNILRYADEAPVLVITADQEAATAIDGMRSGAEDFLSKSEPDLRFLRRATQLAIVRRDRALRMPPLPSVEKVASPTQRVAPTEAERRKHSRYLLTKPIFATPVLPDGSPAATYSADGFSVDVSEGGLRFEIGNLERLPTTHLLVGIEGLDTVLYFATVEARHVVKKGDGLDVGAQFAKGARDLIRKENLEPTFNPSTARYETGLPLEVIMKWVDFGIFRPALFDRTFVCPQCSAIPTFRNGCRVCGSVRLHSRPLIHHFACAHVGYVSDFEQDGAIICPKCRTRNLIVGADFEHLNGPYHCLDCDWSDTELDTVGQCMKCELRFPMSQAIEEDLIGYHVNRLDPLAFINAG